MERICGYDVSLITLNENERYTQSYVDSYYQYDEQQDNCIDNVLLQKIDGILMLAHLMGTHQQCALQTISFRENQITSLAVQLITKSLINNVQLSELHLSYNNIDERGVMAIVELLQSYKLNKTVCDVYIKSGNKVDKDSTLWTDIEEQQENTDDNGHLF